ncbi:bifunctional salicylyl-CoA 5-hydroxylase/oxidoreductase [Flavobacterium arcticum]|uniref:Bifunctional salicylyl-CoA 5-hydroxylase/oxidoreductase n=1 Tax=Flavobacterium arcticum TaxID=1784713 RepID=A0A345HDK8_9FLAO|nr:FAD-dependent monooxygenase [Flavobacterium arcticum]AXG74668.1 bifunctional salicylyl-CoA 5-hydroxylase/oxidoreductase [Flavobacterium arcticum]KAF2512206.1 bifunctional salicylyl-CoA 5-hydroxylase/oxidoreductase [Flavobacterium arcticum]
MKITVIGGGPGGLYFSILLKKAMPDYDVSVYERNKADDSFGFGVVFSDETLSEFLTRDPDSYDLIRSRFAYWDELDVARDGEKVRITGNGFCGCSRKTLLQLLQQRCKEVGVNLNFEANVKDLSQFSDSDIIVAADGINSNIREKYADDFGTEVQMKSNRFVWMGSTRPLDAFTYFFRSTPYGTFVAHTYQYEEGMSTWIFETTDETWQKAGFDVTNEEDTIAKLSELFKEELDGHGLISNHSHWRQFPAVTNKNWHKDNIVLLGDAKATAHYSIGSGTKLAMECAIALADSVIKHTNDIPAVFENYEKLRRNRVEMIQHAANVSLDWFEHMDRHMQHDFMKFAFSTMTRAKKVTFENLGLRDALFTQKVLAEFNEKEGNKNPNTTAAFTPFSLRDMTLDNRIVMSPMEQYSAEEGLVNDWHLMHYGSRATGGLSLILTEATAISPTGRITLGCAGIWSKEQVIAWKRTVDFVHQNSTAKIGVQIGHSGRKGAMQFYWDAKNKAIDNAWELLSASPIPFSDTMAIPREMTIADMDTITAEFVNAAKNADEAGFDMIELQAHHGFLLASFLSPLTNIRADEFGGSIENRLKFPLRVFNAMREIFPKGKPMSVRISASDWAENGITEDDVLAIAEAFKQVGADIINVSTGLTVENEKPAIGRMWQTPFSDMVRNEVNVPTITAGYIQDIDQINTILLNGRADLVALGKTLLLDPYFVRNAQAYEQHKAKNLEELGIPKPYMSATPHLYPYIAGQRRNAENMKKALKPLTHKK